MQRHGPMVWGVCRRLLPSHHDAEDAFQATFLVLVRKAASIAPKEMVGNWLYGVAHQTALKARATAAKRQSRERQVKALPEPAAPPEPDPWRDLEPLLDQELSRLPDKHRVAIVLCDLEGKTRKEAARHLRIPEGTLSTRLRTARSMLARRLARHGLAVSSGALAGLLSQNGASACVPTPVASAATQAATLFAAGQAATGTVSVKVVALAEGVLKSMLLTKLKAVVVLTVLGIVTFGGVALTRHGSGGPRAMAEQPDSRLTGQKDRRSDAAGAWTLEEFAPQLVPVGMRAEAKGGQQEEKERGWELAFRFKNPRFATVPLSAKGGKAVTVRTGRGDPAHRRPREHSRLEGLRDHRRGANPPSKSVAGVAAWGYADPDAAEVKSCTAFVAGLTNAWAVNGDRVWRKVLKIPFRRAGNEMVPAGPAEWVYRCYEVKRAEASKAGPVHAEPLGKIIRVTHQGDEVYISLGQADPIRPGMALNVFGPGSSPAGQRPKAALEVRTVLQPHLSLARVA